MSQLFNQCKSSTDIISAFPWLGHHSVQILLATEPLSVQPIPEYLPASIKTLLEKFPSILRTCDVVPDPTHGVLQHIHTGRHLLIFAKAHHLVPDKHEIAKANLKHLGSAGIIGCSMSPLVSPLHMMPKKDGSLQSCSDYCCLNMLTTLNKFHLLNMQDLKDGLHNSKIFQQLISSKVITKFLSRQNTFQKPPLSHYLACLSICSTLLVFPVPHKLSKE